MYVNTQFSSLVFSESVLTSLNPVSVFKTFAMLLRLMVLEVDFIAFNLVLDLLAFLGGLVVAFCCGEC